MTVTLFDLAAQRTSWLAERQALISQNVANANTPGYRTVDAPDFDRVLQDTFSAVGLQLTDPRHLPAGASAAFRPVESADSEIWDGTHSQNTVTLEQEMLKAGEVRGQYALTTGIVKSFHSLIMTSVRG